MFNLTFRLESDADIQDEVNLTNKMGEYYTSKIDFIWPWVGVIQRPNNVGYKKLPFCSFHLLTLVVKQRILKKVKNLGQGRKFQFKMLEENPKEL